MICATEPGPGLTGRAAPRYAEAIVARRGWVAEWFKAPVLKTGRGQLLVGSNPTPSAKGLGFLLISAQRYVLTYGIAYGPAFAL